MFPEDPTNTWAMIGSRLLWMSPHLLVVLAGIVVAIVFIRRHPRPAVLVLIALVGMIAVGIAGVVARELLMREVYLGYQDFDDVRTLVFGIDITTSVLGAALMGVLIWAAFIARRSPTGAGPVATGAAGVPPTSVGAGPGSGPDQRIPKGFFIASIFGSAILATLLAVPGLVLFATGKDDFVPAAMGLICVGSLPSLYATVMLMVLIYKLWATIQDGEARTTPGKAIGFLFIPLFNFYWIFQVYPGFAKDFNAYIRKRGVDARPVPEGLALAICIVTLASLIPVLGVLIGMVNIVLLWRFMSAAIDGVNTVRAMRRANA